MAYSKVPVRTTSDTNSPNDINGLQNNFNSFMNSAGEVKQLEFESTTATAGLTSTASDLYWKGSKLNDQSGGSGVNQITFSLNSNAYVDTSIQSIVFATAMSFSEWVMYSSAAPDATLAIDVNKNGTSIFGATAFEITAGTNTTSISQSVSFAKFDRCSWGINSIGSNTVGGSPLLISGS